MCNKYPPVLLRRAHTNRDNFAIRFLRDGKETACGQVCFPAKAALAAEYGACVVVPAHKQLFIMMMSTFIHRHTKCGNKMYISSQA